MSRSLLRHHQAKYAPKHPGREAATSPLMILADKTGTTMGAISAPIAPFVPFGDISSHRDGHHVRASGSTVCTVQKRTNRSATKISPQNREITLASHSTIKGLTAPQNCLILSTTVPAQLDQTA